MIARLWEGRASARTATIGLAVGLVTLAGLALWSSVSAQRTTAQVAQVNELSERWSQVLNHVAVTDDALQDFLRLSTDSTRRPLSSSAGTAQDELVWLRHNGTAADTEAVDRVIGLYGDYTNLLRSVVALQERGDREAVARQADLAALAGTSLRKQLTTVTQNKALETTEHLRTADQQNRRLRIAQVGVFVVDVGMVGWFGMVLLSHRRKILRQAAKNEHEAQHDALTGLANRTLLASRMADAVPPFGLLLIDLDRFKEVNDTLGHHCGDELLRQVAKRLVDAVRDTDTVARLGGDEFAVLLPSVGTAANATRVAEKVLHALSEPVTLENLSIEVGGSIGVALCPDDAADGHELLRHADIAMYAAKRSRVGVAVYEPHLHAHGTAQLTAVSELRHAIEHGELVVHYQPKALADSGAVCGVEALVRWMHPARGLLAPAEFIPTAESSGLIEPLTHHVLQTALAQWGSRLPVSVNVSTDCLHHIGFPDRVAALLAQHDHPALTLEITESAIISDPERAVAVLHQLADLGVRLSLDDFGTGYSSIAYLRDLRVHEIKLDRSFVTGMCSDSGNSSIVQALLGLARNFGLQTVAEGVEDSATWSALAALGCDAIQGYYLSKPLPADEVAAWLENRTVAAQAR